MDKSNKNVNIKIDTVPFLPNIYFGNNIKKDFIDFSNAISADKTIFIFNMVDTVIQQNKYNNPNFLLFGNNDFEEYNLPPVNYFYNNINQNNLDKNNYKVLSFRYDSSDFDNILLNQIGYIASTNTIITPKNINFTFFSKTINSIIIDTTAKQVTFTIETGKEFAEDTIVIVSSTTNSSNYFIGIVIEYNNQTGVIKIFIDSTDINGSFTMSSYYYVSILGNEFFRELEITDFKSNKFIVYFYYFKYLYVDNKNPNNYVNYNNFTNNIFYNKENWNVFIYPFNDIITDYSYPITNNPEKLYPSKNSIYNYINDIDFSELKLTNIQDNIDFTYFENKNTKVNKLNKTFYLSKNIKSFNDYINKNKDDENIFISLNEINYYYSDTLEDNLSYLNSNTNSIIADFLKKNKTFVNTSTGTSMSMDNKISYLNTKDKYFKNTTYAQYISNVDLTEKLYDFDLIYCVNSYFDIISYKQYTLDPTIYYNELDYVNKNLRKILLLINPNLVYDDYVNSEYDINNVRYNTVTTSIINLINNPIKFTIDDTNKLKIKVVNNTQITDLNTKSYIICRYLLILSYVNYAGTEDKKIQYYYIYINVAFYNSIYINIINQFKTNTFDVCYVCRDFLNANITTSPTIFNVLKKTNMYQNIIKWNFVDTKIYSFIYNYDLYSEYKDRPNSIIINNFYFSLVNIIQNITYNDGINDYVINNFNNILFEKINNFISNMIIFNNTNSTLGYNKYLSKTDTLFNIVTDTNIDSKYYTEFKYLPQVNSTPDNFVYPVVNGSTQINYLPFGIYKVFKFNNYNPSSYAQGDFNIYTAILSLIEIVKYNYQLLIRVSSPYEYDDKYYDYIIDNSDYNNFINNNNSLFTNRCEMYLIITDINNDIIYVQQNRILCYKLFNFYNGDPNILNRLMLHVNTVSYNNFYSMNIIQERYYPYYLVSNTSNFNNVNSMALDYNKLKFYPHINDNIKDILIYDLERFNNNSYNISELYYNTEKIIEITKNNDNLYKTQQIIDNSVYLMYLLKLIILLKKVKCYFIILNNLGNYYNFPINVPLNSILTIYDFYKIILNDIQELKDACNYIYNLNIFTIPLSKLESFISLFVNITEISNLYLESIQKLFYDNINIKNLNENNISLTIIYIENLIIDFTNNKNDTILNITNQTVELNNLNFSLQIEVFLKKYVDTFRILKYYENSINELSPETKELFLIKNQTLLYLYNINSYFDILNFNKIFDNEFFKITINSLNLIKKDYIFSTKQLETNLKYSYFCISKFITAFNNDPKSAIDFKLDVLETVEKELLSNINNYQNNLSLTSITINPVIINITEPQITLLIQPKKAFITGNQVTVSSIINSSNYFQGTVVSYNDTTGEIVIVPTVINGTFTDITKYYVTVPLTINNKNLNLLLVEINKLISNYPFNSILEQYYFEFYYINDIVYYLNKYVYLIKELLLIDAYKKQILLLPTDNNPNPYDVLSMNLNENIISLKNIINNIDKVYKDKDQEIIHTILNDKTNNVIYFYSQINVFSYNDHLQFSSNNFITNVWNPKTYSVSTIYTLTSNYYIFGYIINPEIYALIETLYQSKISFIDAYNKIIDDNILIKNALNYGFVNNTLTYKS